MQDWDGAVGLGVHGCNEGDWDAPPCATPPVTATGFEAMLRKLFARINVASGPYQMVSVLSDGVVFRCSRDAAGGARARDITAEYMEEVPIEYFHNRYDGLPRLVWHFGYDEQTRPLHTSQQEGTLFQAYVWFYPGDCAATPTFGAEGRRVMSQAGTEHQPRQKEVLGTYDALHTQWDTHAIRVRVGEWLHAKLHHLASGATPNKHGNKQTSPPHGGQQRLGQTTDARAFEQQQWGRGPSSCKPADVPDLLVKCVGDWSSDENVVQCVNNAVQGGAIQPPTQALCLCLKASPAQRSCFGLCMDMALQEHLNCTGEVPRLLSRQGRALSNEASIRAAIVTSPPNAGDGSRPADIDWDRFENAGKYTLANSRWAAGRVDLNVINQFPISVQLFRNASIGGRRLVSRRLEPMQSARIISHERDSWTAEEVVPASHTHTGKRKYADAPPRVVRRWNVDMSNGILQDIVLS